MKRAGKKKGLVKHVYYCDYCTVEYRTNAIVTHMSKYTNIGSQPPSFGVLVPSKAASIIASVKYSMVHYKNYINVQYSTVLE